MELVGFIVFTVFILLPAIAIFSFTYTVTRGVYSWAQHQAYSPPQTKIIQHSPAQKKELVDDYLGYSEEFEDSGEFKDILDKHDFDVRNYLRKR
jgi:hypothetical protein